jgi:GTP-binding protein
MTFYFNQARYLTSAFELSQLVEDEGSEIAFAGRSNAGKSTAINRLTHQKNLCKTSKTPGRTQLINFFELDEQHRLVDLPGYGYAKVPAKLRQHWNQVLARFLTERKSLKGLIILVDIRRGMSELDWGLVELVQTQLPIHILLTKSDKLKKGARMKTLLEVQKQVQSQHISISCFSALSGDGLDDFKVVCRRLLEAE